ncbi:MAG TPA: hypothetical protein VJ440_00500 [Candidatus Brocadiaceae bacterium]|nr:hypothetical protein [Candidatus Brocadiaceae bacterium]
MSIANLAVSGKFSPTSHLTTARRDDFCVDGKIDTAIQIRERLAVLEAKMAVMETH